MWDWLNGLGDIFRNIGPLANFGYSLYNGIRGGGGGSGGGGYQMPAFDPSQYYKDMMASYQPPDFSSMFAGINEMFAQQQAQLQEQQARNMVKQAVSTRHGLQNQGIYDGGAVTPDALAGLMGVDDVNQFKQYLQQYGKDYGWT